MLSLLISGNSLVGMDSDCLLTVSDPASTWMDAKINGKPVTPRKGKPIEINALWYSGLHFIRDCAMEFNDQRTASLSSQIMDTLDSSFHKYLSPNGWLYDVIEPNDASLRPNQLFAISLNHSPLNTLQQKHTFNIVRSRLYTPPSPRSSPAASPISPARAPKVCGSGR
jgi:4-alpha-glucanotransferase